MLSDAGDLDDQALLVLIIFPSNRPPLLPEMEEQLAGPM